MFCLLALPALMLLVIFASDFWVNHNAKEKLYASEAQIPENRVGLLLGTSKYLANKSENWCYTYRIQAAIKLYRGGKVQFLLVSGDNGNKADEPSLMKNDLMAQGVPENKIYLDYAGFRTLDSVVRAKEIFGLTEFTVISQAFHNERAIFLAESYGLNAIGFNATDIGGRAGAKVQLREKLARVKMLLDLLIGKQPEFKFQVQHIGEKMMGG